MELASKEARKSLPGSRGSRQQAPKRSQRSQRRAERAQRGRSAWTEAGPSAEEPQRREAPALSDTLRAPPTESLHAFVSPHSSRLFSRIRKGPRAPSLDPRHPHTGTWVAGT